MEQPNITGYRQLSQFDADMANTLKNASKGFIELLDQAVKNGADARWAAQAKTSMQNACMQGCRAIFKPEEDC